MFRIKAQAPITGIAWGLPFVLGVAHTEDTALAAKLARKGYDVAQEAEAAAPPPQMGEPETGAPEKHTCPVCQKEYKTAKGLSDHLLKEHPGQPPTREPQETPEE